jgi:hypothetical protein
MSTPIRTPATSHERLAAAHQSDLFQALRPPVIAAWGAGRNSTAMLIELIERGETVDVALFADTRSERPQTYRFIPIFREWLDKHGVHSHIVKYKPRNYKNWPPYDGLEENCLTNGTLPSVAFGFGACSIKWKVTPQNQWADQWPLAQQIWRADGKVIKLIGYDCSPRDQRRYAEREGYTDPRYVYRYPLREWGWTLEDCIERICAAGLPVPIKSSCSCCSAVKPEELHEYERPQLRRIVLMEARAKPRLRTIEGLWRRPVRGVRGGTARPGSMTQYIREQQLLPEQEIDAIVQLAPQALVQWQQAVAALAEPRPPLHEWLDLFDAALDELHCADVPDLFEALTQQFQGQGWVQRPFDRCVG